MKMKKVIAAVLGLSLLGSSMAFAADTANQAKLSAFQNVKTSAVSSTEMDQVSGEFAWFLIPLGIAGFGAIGMAANKIQCGTWSVCKAR